jgi:hypothetical protein
MKLPIALVKTWLELSSTKDPESPEAHDLAIKKILHYFSNYDIAEDYVYSKTSSQTK